MASLQISSPSGSGTVLVSILRPLYDSNSGRNGNTWVTPKTSTYIITGNLSGNSTTPNLYVYKNGNPIITPSDTTYYSGVFYSSISGVEVSLNQNDIISFARNSGGGGTSSVGFINFFEKKQSPLISQIQFLL